MIYHFELHKEEDGFWAECVELDSCMSEGKTIDELKSNLKEALDGVLQTSFGHNFEHPMPQDELNNDNKYLKIEPSSDIAFSVLLRHYRISHRKTQESMKGALGMKSRNSYVKLEQKGNPTLKTLVKIVKTFPDFPLKACF
ncbi:MAG: type II toxin-antitoxin system HicB family antitoxin [Spirochaetaceae bacterium]